MSEISQVSRICVYDRAGYGWSEPGPMPRTALQIATELHDLIDRAGIKGPSVLVAHSFGGYIARVYVSRYPDSMGAVVLVDPSVPESQPGPAPAATPPSRSRSFDSLRQWVPPLGWDRVNRLYVGESGLPPDQGSYRFPFVIGRCSDRH